MPAPDDQFPARPGARGEFCTTHWSVVLAAGAASEPLNRQALEELCSAYWFPLYAYVRRRGYSPHDSEDLTQAFFQQLIEKNYVGDVDRTRGRFRTFLLSSLSHFLANEWDKSQSKKRGGGQPVFSFDAVAAEDTYRAELADRVDPTTLFERRWVASLLEIVLGRLEREYANRGQEQVFSILKRFLTGDRGELSCGEAGTQLNLSENAVKQAVHRLRRRYSVLFREEVARLVTDPAEVEDEMRHILSVVGT